MRYFEKQAGLRSILRGVKKGVIDIQKGRNQVTKMEIRRNELLKLRDTDLEKYYSDAVKQRKANISANIVKTNLVLNKLGSTTSPFQGTMLNVQTRKSQRKYKAKILGKKRPDVLIPLWLNSDMI